MGCAGGVQWRKKGAVVLRAGEGEEDGEEEEEKKEEKKERK